MRKFTLCLWLIILAALRLSAQEQTINLPQEKIRLSAAFDLIEDQSGYTVAYNEMLLNVLCLINNTHVISPNNISFIR